MIEAHKDDSTPVWEYVLLCVYYSLVISNRVEDVIRKEIGKYFYVKDSSIGPHSIFLWNKVSKVTLENVVEACYFISSQYVQAPVANVEEYLTKHGKSLPLKATSPFTPRC